MCLCLLDALEDVAQNVVMVRYTANTVISQQGDRGNRYAYCRQAVTLC